MEATARLRYARITPRKARVAANAVRGKRVAEATRILTFAPKKSARLLLKLLESAVANADHAHKGKLDTDQLRVSVCVDQGPTMKRWRARAMGRATSVEKKTSHITIVLGEG